MQNRDDGPTFPRQHRVQLGDDLRSIAGQYYGDPDRWPEVFTANRAALGNEPILLPGQSLVIPVLPEQDTVDQPSSPAVDRPEPDGIVGADGTIVPRDRTPDSPWLSGPPVLPPPRPAPPLPVAAAPLRSVFRRRPTRPDELERIAELIDPSHRSRSSYFSFLQRGRLFLVVFIVVLVLVVAGVGLLVRLLAGS